MSLGCMQINLIKSLLELSETSWENIIPTVTPRFTKRWYEWRKILVIVICSSMDTETSVRLMEIQLQRCGIPKRECHDFPMKCYGILIKIRSTIKITMMQQRKNQLFYLHDSQTF